MTTRPTDAALLAAERIWEHSAELFAEHCAVGMEQIAAIIDEAMAAERKEASMIARTLDETLPLVQRRHPQEPTP